MSKSKKGRCRKRHDAQSQERHRRHRNALRSGNKNNRRRRITRDPVLTVDTQGALDVAAKGDDPILIKGGTPTKPLVIRTQFRYRPIIGDDACVRLVCEDPNRPTDALILGNRANVLACGTARVECKGDSIVRVKDRAKARVYAGKLVAGGKSKSYVYNDAQAVVWGNARCYLKNRAYADCYEHSETVLYHESCATVHTKTALTWPQHRTTHIDYAWRWKHMR